MPYQGTDPASIELVRQYLADNYTNADGSTLSDTDLDVLLATYDGAVADGIATGAFASFVGDQIAANSALPAVTADGSEGDRDPDEDDEDDDEDENPDANPDLDGRDAGVNAEAEVAISG